MTIISNCLARLHLSICRFATAEDGSATVWNLTWLTGFAIMGGVAIDSTNAWRHKTMLASTADVAALAGSMSLPNPQLKLPYVEGGYGALKSKAFYFADRNMENEAGGTYGSYMQADESPDNDVYVGHWDSENRKFTAGHEFPTPDALPVNAVRVFLGQNDENDNNVQTTLLRFVGLYEWDINTTATAMRGYPDCYNEGMMAEEKVCITANNKFYPGLCIHGEKGLNLSPNNEWFLDEDELGSVLSTGADASNRLGGTNPEAIVRPELDVPFVHHIPQIAEGILGNDPDKTIVAMPRPEDMKADGSGRLGVVTLTTNTISANTLVEAEEEDTSKSNNGGTNTGPKGGGSTNTGSGGFGCEAGSSTGSLVKPYDGTITAAIKRPDGTSGSDVLEQHRVYFHDGPNLTINTSGGKLENVIIITTGRVDIANGSWIEGSTIISLYEGQSHGIRFNHTQLGKDDQCASGGGVVMMAQGAIMGSGDSTYNGVVLASGGNISASAQTEGARGLAAFAAGNLQYTAQNTFGPVGEGDPEPDRPSCGGGIDINFTNAEMRSALVE